MDELEQAFGASAIGYVGPFEHHDVIVNGRRVPHLEAIPTAGGGVHLTVGRRYGLDLTLAEAERVVPFIAHCVAVGMGYVGFPDEDQDEPVHAQPMPRVHRLIG